jgi:hypothetical protein
MTKALSINIFFCFIIVVLFSCEVAEKQNANTVTKAHFDSLINNCIERTSDLTNPRELLLLEDFLTIYNNNPQYSLLIKSALADDDYNFYQKQVCIYSVQKISDAQYIEFASYCLKLYKEGKIDDRIFSLLLTPAPFKTSKRVIANYTNRDIQKLLKSIIDSPETSGKMKMKAEIILSGKAFNDLNEMRENGYQEEE